MKIYTSSWFTTLPDTIQKIGVSRGTPRGYKAGYRKLMSLAPGAYFKTASVAQYKQLYFEGLQHLDPQETVNRIEELSGGKDVALLCYEAPTDDQYCHRAYISVWLYETLKIEVVEYGLEDQGFSWRHPKLPAQYRERAKPEPIDVTPWLGSTAPDQTGKSWTVVGLDPINPDQALVEDESGETRSVSADTLAKHFKSEARLREAHARQTLLH